MSKSPSHPDRGEKRDAADVFPLAGDPIAGRDPGVRESRRTSEPVDRGDWEAGAGSRDDDSVVERSEARRFVGLILIVGTSALSLGLALKTPTQIGANDISRWCTVWSLLERGTYAIDECPWQFQTQDKVKKPDKLAAPDAGSVILRKMEYALAPKPWKEGEPTERFYSSKPPLLPTMMAAVLYPIRKATGVALENLVERPRNERWEESNVEGQPGKTEFKLVTPKESVKWPAYVLYLKPLILVLNVVPMLFFLIYYAKLLDRTAEGDWAWFLSLFTGCLGTYLFVYDPTLNNHTVAAWSGFFAIYALQRIGSEQGASGGRYAAAGFFGAFCACNELPAAIFGLLLFLILFAKSPSKTLKYFVPAAIVPCALFLATQYAAFGQFKPVYEEFGTKSYEYYGSKWTTPLEFDWFNKSPEPYGVYLMHMTIGHHGVFSLSPIFVFSLIGALREIFRRGSKLSAVAWLTLTLTIAMFAFYTWNPKARNYGGSAQGLRWLFWLIPFWLATLPSGVQAGQRRAWVRGLTLAALFISALSVGYAVRSPWSHPWMLDMLEHLDLYELKR